MLRQNFIKNFTKFYSLEYTPNFSHLNFYGCCGTDNLKNKSNFAFYLLLNLTAFNFIFKESNKNYLWNHSKTTSLTKLLFSTTPPCIMSRFVIFFLIPIPDDIY